MDIALLVGALDGFGRRLAAVGARWGDPTPCAEWDVRALANHVLDELLWIPPLLTGQTIDEVGDRFAGDQLGDDPMDAWDDAAAAAIAAASEPGAQERITHLSFGDLPGGEYLGQVTSDVVIHTWDLAQAIGADEDLGDALVVFTDAFLSPQIDLWRSAGVFGPAAEVSADASAQDVLLAQTGRTPR